MVIEILVGIVGIILSLLVGSVIASVIGVGGWSAVSVQTIVATGVALLVTMVDGFGLSVGIAITTGPFVINVTAFLSAKIQQWRSLKGHYGEETKWATELIREGDQHFMLALNALNHDAVVEIGVVAESKEELREMVIEEFESMDDVEDVPADFISND